MHCCLVRDLVKLATLVKKVHFLGVRWGNFGEFLAQIQQQCMNKIVERNWIAYLLFQIGLVVQLIVHTR